VHAWGKLMLRPVPNVAEMPCGIALILGLFTRLFAAAASIEMMVIFCLYWANGFAWTRRGYESVLLWGLVCFAIALRGGARSSDRLLALTG
jgi:putative oxidoreductase